MSRLKARLDSYSEGLWWAIALGFTIGVSRLPVTGNDWKSFYRPATLSPDFMTFPGVANPPYILFLFEPLSLLPTEAGNLILLGLAVICFRLSSRLTGASKWLILISFPAWWQLWLTQIDGLVMLGVALGYYAIKEDKPVLQGVATLLLCLKPQVGGVLAIVYLVRQWDYRAFIVSSSVLALSVLAFGFWPVTWGQRLAFEAYQAERGYNFAETITNIGLFPWGLLAWLPVVFLRNHYTDREYVSAVISATMLSSPYAACYSLIAAMAVPLPVWFYPALSIPFLGRVGYDLIIVAPVGLVAWPVVRWIIAHSTIKVV